MFVEYGDKYLDFFNLHGKFLEFIFLSTKCGNLKNKPLWTIVILEYLVGLAGILYSTALLRE